VITKSIEDMPLDAKNYITASYIVESGLRSAGAGKISAAATSTNASANMRHASIELLPRKTISLSKQDVVQLVFFPGRKHFLSENFIQPHSATEFVDIFGQGLRSFLSEKTNALIGAIISTRKSNCNTSNDRNS